MFNGFGDVFISGFAAEGELRIRGVRDRDPGCRHHHQHAQRQRKSQPWSSTLVLAQWVKLP